jgi:hypothetical protein
MATKFMPGRGERSAPTFDQTKPRELYRFFDELERLFERNSITNATEMKKDACRYVDYTVERIWKTFPEFSSGTSSFADFKAAILVHYPDAEGDFVYSVIDLDAIISKTLAAGISTTDALQAFHLEFMTISTWLVDKELMGEIEQRRAYITAFNPHLSENIRTRLRMLFMKQHPNKPHKITDVYEAAHYVLQDGSIVPQSSYSGAPRSSYSVAVKTVPVPATSSDMPVKAETFVAVMANFTKTITDALSQSNHTRVTGVTPPRQTNCNFCGGPHFIRECGVVDEYIVAGKVRRNFEGKVVLSTGAFVPREIPGTLLQERVNEWHHRNPGQLAAVSLIHTISAEHVRTHTHDHVHAPVVPAFQLSTSERITVLEAELFSLKARKSAFVPTVRTRAQRAREGPSGDSASIEEVDELPVAPEPVIVDRRDPTPVAVVTPQAPNEVPPPVVITDPLPFTAPEHPFRNAKDASYAPPISRNVGGIVKPLPVKKSDALAPQYKTLPPVHDPAIAVNVYKRAMDAPVTITQRELLSLSPEVRAQVREITTTRRLPINTDPADIPSHNFQMINDDEEFPYDWGPNPAFALKRTDERLPPKGATIVADPVEEYYNQLEPGEIPSLDRLTVAKDSTAIRSIHALVDSSQKKECTVDPGCQVIAMSEATCHSLGLAYDPRIRLNMESANGSFDWSLGLARNIPFLVGTITLYLQVHVIRSPSYEILLGRPFDVLTESIIRNYTNEDQTITITDPNSGTQCTIPTFARGTRRVPAGDDLDF